MKKTLLLTFSALALTACTSTSTHIIKKTESPYSHTSYILKHSATSLEQTQEEIVITEYFAKALANSLKNANIESDLKNYDSIIQYNILFDEGNRALRYFVGFGAGAAIATIKIDVKARGNNESTIELSTTATMSIGLFGGDAMSVLDNAANDIVTELIKSNIFQKN